MAKKPVSETALTDDTAQMAADAALAAHFADADMPGWFDPAQHSIGGYGIVETATGTLLDEDGLPQSGPARAALRDRVVAELAKDAPAADAAADPQA